MTLNGYAEVEHTADVALKVWGEDFHAFLRQAAKGLYDLMGLQSTTGQGEETGFTLTQGTPESVLVDFLTELLYFVESVGLALDEFGFDEDDYQVLIRAVGRKTLLQERYIKAATFHNLSVEKTPTGVIATITFDV